MKMRAPHATRGLGILIGALVVTLLASVAMGAVEKDNNGVIFTYHDPDAGAISIAGTFNGWNTSATPMVNDGSGNWSVVVSLGLGSHEYKFVVDGAWITDPDNPSTKGDGYGGVNSVVEVDAKGELVQKGDARPISNTLLNSKVFIGGRYLSRTRVEKNVEGDPRWRMQRPVQNVDFNFNVTISELVEGYSRLRIDTEEKILQPNNISAYLDEAHITITTDQFEVTGFHNEETLSSSDPLTIIGDEDLPGTIFDDHLDEGKGQAGLAFTANRYGTDFQGILSNVHDYDIYNDPNLYDNTGTDIGFARLSRDISKVTVGANATIMRNLWWLDFTSLVGTTPAATGLPRLDRHIDETGDASQWFEFEDKNYLFGGDVSLPLYDGKLLPQFEFLAGTVKQSFVTSNNSGIDFGNGPIDVTILDRDLRIAHGSVESTLIPNVRLNAEHTRTETTNPDTDESMLMVAFLDDETANKQLFFVAGDDPATIKLDYSELEVSWTGTRYSAVLWLQRDLERFEPVDTGIDKAWYYDASVSPGVTAKPHDRLALELEQQWRWREGSKGLENVSTVETILRGSFFIGKDVSAICDVRYLRLKDELADETDDYTAPFAGFRYDPTKKVSVVLAYGVDPVDFDIDYNGRQIGRERFRREYLWANAGATWRDAEEALADTRTMVLRAIYRF